MPEVRLIDANVLFLKQKSHADLFRGSEIHDDIVRRDEATMALAEILNAPTIEAEPVRHGRWILCEDQHGVGNDNNNYAYFCSQCHYQDVHSKYAKVNFCWNCGSMNREV